MHSIISNIIRIVKDKHLDIILALMIATITYTSFRFGQISSSSLEKKAIVFSEAPEGYEKIPALGSKPDIKTNTTKAKPKIDISTEPVYASKRSKNKYYHYSSCPSFKQLSKANLLTFINSEQARANGFNLAPNCANP